MKNTRSLRFRQALAGLALAALGSSAFATSTWDLSTGCSGSSGSGTNLGTSVTCAGTGAGATIYGYSTGAVTTPTTTTNFVASSIYTWGSAGLGVVAPNENASDTGPHAMDNAKGTDALMIKFTTGVSLNNLTIGWNGTDNTSTTNGITYNDSDVSVLAYVGGVGLPSTPTVTNSSLSTLLSNGWQLVANLADVGNGNPTNTASFTSSVTSSYWLISAYSSSYGGTVLDSNIDAFKLLTVAGCATGDTSAACKTTNTNVPEPGSLALLGAGLFGIVAARRRRNGQNA